MICSLGPGVCPASMSFFKDKSVYGSMLPVVRAVVTPPARYSRGALSAISPNDLAVTRRVLLTVIENLHADEFVWPDRKVPGTADDATTHAIQIRNTV